MAKPPKKPAQSRLTEALAGKARRRRSTNSRAHQASERATGAPRRNDLRPTLELVDIPLDQLHAPARAVRKLDPAHVADVAANIGAFGFSDPILVGADRRILDGVVRHVAAKQLGLSTVPCILL